MPVATNKRVCEELRVFEKCNVTTVTAGLGIRPVWNWPGEQELSKCSPGHCYSTSATCDHNNTIFANTALCFTVTQKGKVSFLISGLCMHNNTNGIGLYKHKVQLGTCAIHAHTSIFFTESPSSIIGKYHELGMIDYILMLPN